jgi:hypothetical protein
MSMGEPQLWRGDLWRLQPLMDTLAIHLPRGYLRLEYVNLSGNLRITTVDDRCTVQKDEFVWVRDGRLECGDIDELAEAREKERLVHRYG